MVRAGGARPLTEECPRVHLICALACHLARRVKRALTSRRRVAGSRDLPRSPRPLPRARDSESDTDTDKPGPVEWTEAARRPQDIGDLAAASASASSIVGAGSLAAARSCARAMAWRDRPILELSACWSLYACPVSTHARVITEAAAQASLKQDADNTAAVDLHGAGADLCCK
jgi:hypothetical protein